MDRNVSGRRGWIACAGIPPLNRRFKSKAAVVDLFLPMSPRATPQDEYARHAWKARRLCMSGRHQAMSGAVAPYVA